MRNQVCSLASGGGSTFAYLADEMKAGNIPMDMSLLIVDNANAGAIVKAGARGIPFEIVDKETFRLENGKIDHEAFGRAIVQQFTRYNINIALQNGWTPWTHPNVAKAVNFATNQHPGHPDFAGKGMASSSIVQTAVVDFQHRVDRPIDAHVIGQYLAPQYDAGAILESDHIPVEEDITPDELQKRLIQLEWDVQKKMLLAFHEGRLEERILPPVALPGEEEKLRKAKEFAIRMHTGKRH